MSNLLETNGYAVGATLRSFRNCLGERTIAPVSGPSTGGVRLQPVQLMATETAGAISNVRHVDGLKARQTMFPLGARYWRPPE